jgi:uncharacterized protein (TIGR03086 family)
VRPGSALGVIDLTPATTRMSEIVEGIGDDQLDAPTPCPDSSVATLLDHVDGLAQAFRAAAAKDLGPLTDSAPEPAAGDLVPDWRHQVPQHLVALASAWRDPRAWEGMTRAGGVDLPGEVAGLVAIDELVVHAWDLAVATGQPYEPTDEVVTAARTFAEGFGDADRDGSLFGPIVPVPDDASPLDQLLGLTGRDPRWRPPT